MLSDTAFLEKATPHTLEVYQKIIWQVESHYGPVMEVFEVEGTREKRLVIGYKMGGTSQFFSALSNLCHFYQLYSARKYVEQFSNGIMIISLYLNPMPGSTAAPIEHSIFQVMKEASLLYCLPDNPFSLIPSTLDMLCKRRPMLIVVGFSLNTFSIAWVPAYPHLKTNQTPHMLKYSMISRDASERKLSCGRALLKSSMHIHPPSLCHFTMVHYPAVDESLQLRSYSLLPASSNYAAPV
ncbi:hypothetical protein DFH29DRAFT_1025461 [Suillus ampliporus]|nr:hypothetical protein DFH29DRAFT_1025461 [Suillus ampliporus]